MTSPLLSIIIPAHNEEERLPPSLDLVAQFVSSRNEDIEVIVVENGSQDNTYKVATDFQAKMSYLRVLQEKTPGKGRAVRAGMLAAVGQYRIFCDADFSMPVDEIARFIPTAANPYDVAIASRELPASRRINEPEYRHLIGRIFNSMVRWSVLPGLHDTQCGFKAFRGEIADQVFRIQTLTGWSFDAEVLVIARQNGYHIQEVPITWYYKRGTRLHIIKDSIKMGMDLLTIRRNARKGLYVRPQNTH